MACRNKWGVGGTNPPLRSTGTGWSSSRREKGCPIYNLNQEISREIPTLKLTVSLQGSQPWSYRRIYRFYFGTWGCHLLGNWQLVRMKDSDSDWWSPLCFFELHHLTSMILKKDSSIYFWQVSLEHAQHWLRFHPSNSWIGNRIPGPSRLHCDRSHGHWRGIGPIHTVLGPCRPSEFAGGQSLPKKNVVQKTPRLYQIRTKTTTL